MRLLNRKPPLMLLLIVALLALLPLLAVFQYYWLGEVSKGERERMESNLKVSVGQFCQDFDRELKNVYLHFQNNAMPFGSPADATSDQDFAAQYRRWLDTSPHPRLVSEIYQMQIDESEKYQLARFNPDKGLFEPYEWPEKLRNLREKMERERAARESAHMLLQSVVKSNGDKRIDKPLGGTFIRLLLGPVDDEIPALIIPLIPPQRPFESGNFSVPVPRKHRVVILDLDYLKQELIPRLAKQYFSNDGRSDYYIAVVRRDDPQKVIYQSGTDLPKNFIATSDVSDYLFKIQMTEADRLFIAGMPDLQGESKRVIEKGQESKSESKRLAVSVIRSDINFSSRVTGTSPHVMGRPAFKLSGDGQWQVALKHRAGSLESAVAGVRRRNLAISFGILLLLGVSVGLIVLSSRRAQKLASQQMEFVAGVSHELRTPLTVICSAAENLADGVIDNQEQIKRYGSLIRDEGRRLTEMVEQVLEFAGATSGRRTYELRPIELSRVIEDALATCHLQLVEGGFEIEKKVAATLPVVNADAAGLSRAIQNLLNNAMKYSGESRWLGLSAECVKTPKGEEAQIKISDRGIGIAPAELSHVFEPFYRGKDVIAAQIHGNGLGLSLVKHIIEAHGGRVSIESKVKQGTTFTLHLPAHPTEELSTESAKDKYEQTHFAR